MDRMRRTSLAHRLTSIVFGWLYLVVVGMGPFADAVLEAEAVAHAAHGTHVEPDDSCDPGHHDVICEFARISGGTHRWPGEVLASLPVESYGRASVLSAADEVLETRAVPPVGTRAPPTI